MARGKKAAASLTPEEKLQQALVPVEDQPYEIPENWCWVNFGTVCKFENGYAFKSDRFSNEHGIPVIRISNIKENEVDIDSCVYTTETEVDEKFIVQYGDLLIAMSGATTGKNGIYLSDKTAYLNQRVGNIKIINDALLNANYRNYYILEKTDEILRNAYGGAQPNISSTKICAMSFPLAPFKEQQRIVDHVESIFAKLDEAKEKAQAVVDGFELRKSAILHKAFTGELTAQWRQEHGVGLDSWVEAPLGDYSTSQYGYTEKSSVDEIGPHFLRITDIQDGKVLWNEVPYCKIDDETKEKYVLSIGDIVVARTGATTGKSYMVMDDVDSVFASYLIRVSISKKELLAPEYLYLFMQSPKYWGQIMELSQGVAQPGVNGKKLQTLTLPVPSMEEQLKIVEFANGILPRMDQSKEAAEIVLVQIDTMKKAVLARAFRGELGTNDPAEESAMELLKSVL